MKVRNRVYTWREMCLILGAMALGIFAVNALAQEGARSTFISSEVHFTDESHGGLAIVPASCASSPSRFHNTPTSTADGKGYYVTSGTTEYGVTRNGVSLCVSNFTGKTYFIPANTAAEMNAFKTIGTTTVPNLWVW